MSSGPCGSVHCSPDCARDRGDVSRAVGEYERLVAETAGTPWEGVMRQHLGKVLFTARRFADAVEEFALALRLREEAGADDDLLSSSLYALEVARGRAEGC